MCEEVRWQDKSFFYFQPLCNQLTFLTLSTEKFQSFVSCRACVACFEAFRGVKFHKVRQYIIRLTGTANRFSVTFTRALQLSLLLVQLPLLKLCSGLVV
jgi:hypothetical protein